MNHAINTANDRRSTSDNYAFDNVGNTTADAEGRTFVYDAENKQIEVLESSVTVGEYFYDGDGRRIKKRVPAVGETPEEITVFVYDAGGKLIQEHSTIVQPTQDAKTVYTTNDHLGSPRINTDATGQVISRHDYHPFGEEVARSGYGSDIVRKQFTGYERDTESELDFAEARYYNPMHGRFTSPDPLLASAMPGHPQSWNRYIYVGNNPLVITDPTGLKWYYSSAEDRYKWFGDNDTVDDGFVAVVGTQGNDDRGVGSFVYQQENGSWVRLNPYINQYSEFDNRGDAVKNFEGVYQCNCQGLVNTIADESVKKGTTVGIAAGVAVAVGTGAGVAMAATGTAVGGTVTTLGLTGTGTATTAATTTAVTFTSHGAVHAATEGFSRVAAESAIRAAVQNIAARAATTGEFWGKVTVGGSTIVYRAYTLADGTIRIGTYYDPTKK